MGSTNGCIHFVIGLAIAIHPDHGRERVATIKSPAITTGRRRIHQDSAKDILGGLLKGSPDKAIARALSISAWTVHAHLKNIYEKLSVRSRTEAVIKYLQK